MKKIIIAVDSFKGSLSSSEIAIACENGVLDVFPNCKVIKLSIADGGEGTLDALVSGTGGSLKTSHVNNPIMKVIPAQYAILGNGQTAFIEMAQASGLTLISNDQRNPLKTTTYGTGELIKDAIENGCRHIILGIGGSATNDAGLGMLQALGFKFYDKQHILLGFGGEIMEHVAYFDTSAKFSVLNDVIFTIACDVNNPFYGENGAAYIFAKQKGANPSMVKQLDNGLKNIARLVADNLNINIQNISGAGAAGGLGGACVAFLGASLKSGISIVLEALEFQEQLKNADLVITGEGKIDEQTLMGKAPQGVLTEAKKANIPVIAIAGGVENIQKLNEGGFSAVFSITPYPMPLNLAMDMETTRRNIQNTISQIMRTISLSHPIK